jgi:hypothetical protein
MQFCIHIRVHTLHMLRKCQNCCTQLEPLSFARYTKQSYSKLVMIVKNIKFTLVNEWHEKEK